MVASAAGLDWQRCQDALRDEVERVTALVRSLHDPGAGRCGGPAWRGRPRSGIDELLPERAVATP